MYGVPAFSSYVEAWNSPLFPNNKWKTKQTGKSTTLHGSRRDPVTQGKLLPQVLEERQANTGSRCYQSPYSDIMSGNLLWNQCCRQNLKVKNSRGTKSGVPTLLWDLPSGTQSCHNSKYQRKLSSCFWQVEGNINHFEILQTILFFLNKACPQERLVNQSLTRWGIN